jgi:hypothetical protein
MHRLDESGDRRAVYLRDYALSLCNVMSALESGRVADSHWTLALLDLFSDFYLATLESVHPFPTAMPPSWEVAHRLAANPNTAHGDLLMLSLNAHINNDLPQALATVLDREWPIPPQLLAIRREDFWRLMDIIAETQHAGCAGWTPERFVLSWRSDVWDTALALVTADDMRWQTAICEDLEHAALKRAHLIACVPAACAHVLALPTYELHRIFDGYRRNPCRCGIAKAACDTWVTSGV